MLKKIVAIGPESTGKSSLCAQLAQHYGTMWCPEYAREYLLKHGTTYTYEDLLTIAKGQVALEEKYIKLMNDRSAVESGSLPYGHLPLFIDTDMYVMKVWCEFVFGKCHSFILEQIGQRKYDLYLLCKTDLEWVPDELREYPDPEPRHKLYERYQDILANQNTPWVVIAGDHQARLDVAIESVNNLIKQ